MKYLRSLCLFGVQEDLVELDCETLPDDLMQLGQGRPAPFRLHGAVTSGDIIRHGADGRGGRLKTLASNTTAQVPSKVTCLCCNLMHSAELYYIGLEGLYIS